MQRERPPRTHVRSAGSRRLVVSALSAVVLAACSPGGTTAEGADRSTGQDASATAGDTTTPDGGSDRPTSDGGDDEPTSAATPVPDQSVTSFEGEEVSLADYEGTPMVVNFWASWCPPCIAEMPDLEEVHQAAGDRIAFVGINTQDTPEEAGGLVEETGVTYDLLRDPSGELFRAFGGFGMPSTFYVDADGRVVGRHTGLLTRDALVEDLQEELAVEVDP